MRVAESTAALAPRSPCAPVPEPLPPLHNSASPSSRSVSSAEDDGAPRASRARAVKKKRKRAATHPTSKDLLAASAVERAVLLLANSIPDERRAAALAAFNETLIADGAAHAAVVATGAAPGALARSAEWMGSWRPNQPVVQRALVDAWLAGGLDGACVARRGEGAAAVYKLVSHRAVDAVLAGPRHDAVVGDAETTKRVSLSHLAGATLRFAAALAKSRAAEEGVAGALELQPSRAPFPGAPDAHGAGVVFVHATSELLREALREVRRRCDG